MNVAMLQKPKANSLLYHSATTAICAVNTATLISHMSPPGFSEEKNLDKGK